MNTNPRRATNSGHNPTPDRAGQKDKRTGGVKGRDGAKPNQQGNRTQRTQTNQSRNQSSYQNKGQSPNQPKRAARPQNQNANGGRQKQANNGRQKRTNNYGQSSANPQKKARRRTPEEIAALKAERARIAELERKRLTAERKRVKAERAARRKLAIAAFKKALVIFALRAVVTVGCAAVFFGMFTAVFFMGLFSADSPRSGEYLYRVGIAEDVYSETEASGDKVYRDGAYYVELTSAATYLRLITTGDVGQIRFILRDSGTDSVMFTRDSAAVTINGMQVNLTAPVRIENGEIWVPIEFFERYVSGVKITTDAKERVIELSRSLTPEAAASVTAYRTSLADKDKNNDIELEDVIIGYAQTSLNLRTAEASEKIPEYSLGVELLEMTDPVAKIIAESSGELIGD